MSRSIFILILIVFVGLVLRFYNLGNVPVGFHRDEAFLGYNAYSLLQTGKDMTGDLFPIHLQSFLYSPAGYSYASIPFIWFFGLNEFAVRFASAIFGTATVGLVYLFVKELFGSRQGLSGYVQKLALLSTFFFAISPWHINLSRVATENVLVVFFVTLGTYFYLLWVRKGKIWLLLCAFLAFGLTLILYQAPRAFLPFFIPLLLVCFHPKAWSKYLILKVALFSIIIILPIFVILSSHDLTQRIRMLSIFQHPQTQLILDEQIREDGSANQNVLTTRFFHNKAINYSVSFFENYFNHFSYDFFFLDKGLPDRYRIPQMGLLYFFELPLLLFGLWGLSAFDKRRAIFLGGWVLLSPIGSALTYDDIPNLQRTLIMLPALTIIIAFGFLQLWKLLQKVRFTKLWQGITLLVMVYGFLYYLHQYYIHQVNHRPFYRQEGYKELVAQLHTYETQFTKIVITDAESDPAIFFLFYNQVNPHVIHEQFNKHHTTAYGYIPIDNYLFAKEPCPLRYVLQDTIVKEPEITGEKGVLYVNSGNCEFTDDRVAVLSKIVRSDGTLVFSLQFVKQ